MKTGKIRAFRIEDRVEDRLNEMSKKGVSRSFFCNKSIKERLKKLGMW